MSHIITQGTDSPVCPFCGYVHKDSWEWSDSYDNGDDRQCDSCDMWFYVVRQVHISWRTVKSHEVRPEPKRAAPSPAKTEGEK